MSAFGSATLTSPTAANEANTPPVVGSDRTEMYGTPAARRRSSAAIVLASCISASVPSCIRAPPEALTMMSGIARGEGVLGGAGHLLADDRAHRAAHEPEVHDAQRRGRAPERARPPDRGIAHAGGVLGGDEPVRIRLLVDEPETCRPTGGRRRAPAHVPGSSSSSSRASADSRK